VEIRKHGRTAEQVRLSLIKRNCILKKFFFFRNDALANEARTARVDNSFVPFISENLLAYTEIFQLVVPRFLRLNLTVLKNAVMLFRLTKVCVNFLNVTIYNEDFVGFFSTKSRSITDGR
jgi:hypothetical protein